MGRRSNEVKALLIIDMLKDFLDKNGALFCGKDAQNIIPFVREKIEQAHKQDELVIYVCDSHKKDDLEFNLFPKHCVEGTEGAEVIDELEVLPSDIIVKKTRYSGFYKTELERILKENQVDSVEVIGVCTSICVMDTVGDLRNRDYQVTVYKDGVADFGPEAGKFALNRMEKIYGVKIL